MIFSINPSNAIKSIAIKRRRICGKTIFCSILRKLSPSRNARTGSNYEGSWPMAALLDTRQCFSMNSIKCRSEPGVQ